MPKMITVPDLASQEAAQQELRNYCRLLTQVWTGPQGAVSPYHRLLESGYGMPFTAKAFHGKRMRAKQCYANAGRVACFDDAFTYCEGFVAAHEIPIEHAWLLDTDGQVIDPTLKAEGVQGYYGIAIPHDTLAQVILDTETWGCILWALARREYEAYVNA